MGYDDYHSEMKIQNGYLWLKCHVYSGEGTVKPMTMYSRSALICPF